MKHFASLPLSIFLCVTPLLAGPRIWTSADGKFTVEAELVRSNDTTVTLKKLDDSVIDVPLVRLSESDRAFLARGAEAPATLPAVTIDGVPILTPHRTLAGHKGGVWCLAFSPNGKFLATGGGTFDRRKIPGPPGEAILWDTGSYKRVSSFPVQGGRVLALAFSTDGKVLATGHEDQLLGADALTALWNVATKRPQGRINVAAQSLAFSKDGKYLALGGTEMVAVAAGRHSQPAMILWNLREARVAHRLKDATSVSVAFSPDSATLVSGSQRSEEGVRVWDVLTGKLSAELPNTSGSTTAVAYAPDGLRLAFSLGKPGQDADEIVLWDLKANKSLLAMRTRGHVNAISVSHNGALIAVATGWAMDGAASLWDVTTGRPVAVLNGHTDVVKDIAFSGDDSVVATCSLDKTVRLWKVPKKSVEKADGRLGPPILARHSPRRNPRRHPMLRR